MRAPRLLVAALLAAAAAAPAAAAPSPFNVHVTAINGDGTAQYSVCNAGGDYRFPAIPGATVGSVWTVDVDMATNPWTVTNPRPKAGGCGGFTPGPGQTTGPGQTFGPVGVDGDGTDELEELGLDLPKKAFGKVHTFKADADGFGDGILSVTYTGKLFKGALEDVDGLVLVGKLVKVFDRKGDRVRRGKLDDADSVAVKGKLLPTGQWHEDEDGNAVPTVRAKRITITR